MLLIFCFGPYPVCELVLLFDSASYKSASWLFILNKEQDDALPKDLLSNHKARMKILNLLIWDGGLFPLNYIFPSRSIMSSIQGGSKMFSRSRHNMPENWVFRSIQTCKDAMSISRHFMWEIEGWSLFETSYSQLQRKHCMQKSIVLTWLESCSARGQMFSCILKAEFITGFMVTGLYKEEDCRVYNIGVWKLLRLHS